MALPICLQSVVFVTLFSPLLVSAATIVVTPGQSIESAIRGAQNGDVVEVAPGTYNQTIRFWGKAVTLRSQSGPENTIIDGGSQLGPLISFFDNESRTSVVDGFTLLNGVTSGGGGAITAQNGASPTIRNNIIRNNRALIGAGIYLYKNSSPLIEKNVFNDNHAEGNNAGGGAIAASYGGHPLIRNNTFSRNTVYGNPASGGAVFISQGSGATIDDNDFSENSCTFNLVDVATGGAVHTIHDTRGSGGVVLSNNRFRNNIANYGGAAGAEAGASVMLVNNEFTGNRAHYYGGAFISHAIQPVGAYRIQGEVFDLVFDGNRFSQNSAAEFGGAIMLSEYSRGWIGSNDFIENAAGVSGGAIHLDRSVATIVDNTIQRNNAALFGAGLFIYRNSTARVERNWISANTFGGQGKGGGMYMAEATLQLRRNAIMNHRAESGGGLFVTQAREAVISQNNLFAMNQADFGSAIFVESSQLQAIFDTLANNVASAADPNARSAIFPRSSTGSLTNAISVNSDPVVSRYDLSSSIALIKVRDSNPGFVNAGGTVPENYRLTSSSAAIDQADSSSIVEDRDGRPRPVGKASDLGAYEYSAEEFIAPVALYRFWNEPQRIHFYSGNAGERNYVLHNLDWRYEGPSYYAYALDRHPAAAVPVYRFYNSAKGHFYTISASEKAAFDNNSSWSAEGPQFTVFADQTAYALARPVYRFKERNIGSYFYTISEDEKNLVLTLSNWSFEGIGFYALPSR
ncbi:MAG: right-handed parallel beta-helix repeat-containing protein [Candidatus Contendobacter sp.]|jgi:parallel beta-helix repeat protein|nr:right-handed parallel beta-helix repeat-containing protein [Gammaproteobacteria bacterium]MCC8992741.1 right-handed parallel beta-helix repeat-containing protein [Candidatus Contendobacter sp.]